MSCPLSFSDPCQLTASAVRKPQGKILLAQELGNWQSPLCELKGFGGAVRLICPCIRWSGMLAALTMSMLAGAFTGPFLVVVILAAALEVIVEPAKERDGRCGGGGGGGCCSRSSRR